MKWILTIPRGATSITKNVTIHDMIHHLVLLPMQAIRISIAKHTAPNLASGTGHTFDTAEVMMVGLFLVAFVFLREGQINRWEVGFLLAAFIVYNSFLIRSII